MMTTIVVILIVWVALSVPVSFVAARMLRTEHRNTGDPSTTRADEFHPGRSLR